ncbi:MAG: 50S ribosomal protein L11 methyltransferase [Ferruginibacter sp.]
MQHLEFTFITVSQDKKDILIAMLSDAGFNGFEEEENNLKAFVPAAIFDEESFHNITEITQVKFSRSTIDEINWNEKWESDFEPVIVLDPVTKLPFAMIRASFHKRSENVKYDIEVTPKMSFGTGHHATTYLMMETISHISFQNKTVLDFGTGTGVLAILAEKMGAEKIIAIDNDDWSINNATENFNANGCTKIELQKADTIPGAVKADIILANINLNIITANLSKIINACNNAAIILFSGIMVKDKQIIVDALNSAGITIIDCYERQNWIAVETMYIKK